MSETTGSASVYRFGVFEVDVRSGELLKQGRRVKLRGRPFDILVLLLARGGDVVSRDELRQQLWAADTFVDFDHGLNAAVNRLRDALGDSAENPRFIETLPKRGYRFIAPVSGAAPESAPPAERRARRLRAPLVLALGALAAAMMVAAVYLRVSFPSRPASSRMTLAVLPFQNLSTDADQEFLSDGFTEEMIAELGRLDPDRLGVIARTTTMLYKNARKSIGDIKKELGVDYVLEGSIRRAADRVRITAQLVQTSDMTHLWAQSYDRDVSDVLAIESEVAMKIARSLALALSRGRDRPDRRATSSFPAYELCLRGRAFRDQATEEAARKAIEYFQRAIALDPGYAPAHAGLADSYWLLGAPGWEVDPPADLLRRAQASAERALAIDPQSAEAHAVLAMVRLSYQWDARASEREIQEAIRLNPSFAQAHQYYSTTLTTMGRFDEAIREAHRAMEIDPLSAPAGTTLGIRYLYAGRCPEAAAQFARTLESSPEFGVSYWGLAQCDRERGERDREIAELRRAVELTGNSAYMRAHLAYGLALAGDRDRAQAIRRELEAEGRERYAPPYHFALIAAGLGDRSAVVEWLQRAFADRSGWMVFLAVQPEFRAMRQWPEIQRLLADVTPRTSGE
jgi:TolB-like protein/DNA-binding winged helix-turn-helix (wHTH) protein/Tfp pilus assembly protein PilF